MLRKIFLTIIFSLLLVGINSQSFSQEDDKVAVLHTNMGKIVIEFFPNDAPNHVENFKKLTQEGFYDNTLFHRIIPDFMIQGGDPKTRPDSASPSSEWGTGGPDYLIDAEFNDIKHNRGIVSMARSQDPNSAGSQFFIVHKDSNFLDGQYTVFGRIITEESFETLDKIIAVETGDRDNPINIEEARILKVELAERNTIPDIITLDEPERMTTPLTSISETGLYKNDQLEVAFSAPTGWTLQEPSKTQPGAPDVVAIGPQTAEVRPVISLTVFDRNGQSLDDHVQKKLDSVKSAIDTGRLEILKREKTTINGKEASVIEAVGIFMSNGTEYDVKFKEVVLSTNDRFFTFSYSNAESDYNAQLSKFDESVDSFEVLAKETEETSTDWGGGGCLIATATYGSELAPQVQQLRELRDDKLLKTKTGANFMNTFNEFYYSFSPTIADLERNNPIFKEAVKLAITPMISSLSILNHVDMDSESEVIAYGTSLILLNIGMYFVAPMLVINRLRK